MHFVIKTIPQICELDCHAFLCVYNWRAFAKCKRTKMPKNKMCVSDVSCASAKVCREGGLWKSVLGCGCKVGEGEVWGDVWSRAYSTEVQGVQRTPCNITDTRFNYI